MENRTEPSCHAQRFSQNSEGWTVVKVTRTRTSSFPTPQDCSLSFI